MGRIASKETRVYSVNVLNNFFHFIFSNNFLTDMQRSVFYHANIYIKSILIYIIYINNRTHSFQPFLHLKLHIINFLKQYKNIDFHLPLGLFCKKFHFNYFRIDGVDASVPVLLGIITYFYLRRH